MQSMKRIVVVGCLLVATTAQAWDDDDWSLPDDYDWGVGAGGDPIQPPRREEPRRDRWRDFVEEESEASRLYYQTKPWREYNEIRNACDAITGNDAARADCFRGLGGW